MLRSNVRAWQRALNGGFFEESGIRRSGSLDSKERYLQLAFNSGISQARRIIPQLPGSDRIIVEAGTPFIKRHGMRGVASLAAAWGGPLVADLKVADGAAEEVFFASESGATAATCLGSAPVETLDRFIAACERFRLDAMVDMLGVDDPLRVLMQLKRPPSVVILHRGRDEESTRGKVIGYRHGTRIKSKFDVLISAAGGVDLREARSAIFNGASIVVVNIVSSGDVWVGIDDAADVGAIAQEFLRTIE